MHEQVTLKANGPMHQNWYNQATRESTEGCHCKQEWWARSDCREL